MGDSAVFTGGTAPSEANTALPFESCPVTTLRTPLLMPTVYLADRRPVRGIVNGWLATR